MPTYKLVHYGPRGQKKGEFAPDTARLLEFSVRVDGSGDCRNGVLQQFTKGKGVLGGDWLELWLDEADGANLKAMYAGEIRVANGEEFSESSDLNLAGGMARLEKIEVRLGRIPSTGEADPGVIAREAVASCQSQAGTVISSDVSQLPDTGAAPISVVPYFTPLASLLKGLAGAVPNGAAGVDARRRVFLGTRSSGALVLNEADPRVSVEARKVNAERICTAVRWQLGTADDGHPITHLSVNQILAGIWGEHTQPVSVSDGLLYVKPLPFEVLDVRPGGGAVTTLRDGTLTAELEYNVLTDRNPSSRLRIEQTGDMMPDLRVYATGRRRIDLVRLDVTSTAQRVVNLNAFEALGKAATGGKGLRGMYAAWQGYVYLLTGGRPGPTGTNDLGQPVYPPAVLEVAGLEPYEIDRAALDLQAERYYRVPVENPVDIRVHGMWLPPMPSVTLERVNGTVITDQVAEIEYVSRQGWWGTIIHVGQARDGEAEAVADAVGNRDALALASGKRGDDQLAAVTKGAV